jgi:hypothetical protein
MKASQSLFMILQMGELKPGKCVVGKLNIEEDGATHYYVCHY